MSMNAPRLMLLAASPGFLESWFADFSSDQRLGITIALIVCLTVVATVSVITITTMWATNRQQDREMELKRDLLDEGRSAEEIERILRPSDGFTRAMGGWFGAKKH